jgi:hypothetical protein
MAYNPAETIARMKELMKHIDTQIMMCDDKQDLIALASIMIVTAKNIYVQQLGKDGAKTVLQTMMRDMND